MNCEHSQLKAKINDWLMDISKTENLPSEIEAIYIGIIEGEPCYYIYMTGSSEYDPEEDDWACNEDFTPERKYLDSQVDTDNVKWKDFEDMVVSIVKSHMTEHDSSILNKVKHVGVGFDDGDLVHLL